MNLEREGKFFDVFLLVIIGIFIGFSFTFNDTARLFPLYFGIIAFVFVLLNLIVSSMENPPKILKFIKQKGAMSGIKDPTGEEEEDDDEDLPWSQIIKVVIWLVGFIVGLAFLNYLVATFLFLFLLLVFGGKVPWLKSLYLSIGFIAFLFLLFELVL